jgi:hypothetical protein
MVLIASLQTATAKLAEIAKVLTLVQASNKFLYKSPAVEVELCQMVKDKVY